MKSLAAHVATALITMSLALIWLGERRTANLNAPATDSRPTTYQIPDTMPPLSDTPRDIDKEINIRVYEAVNRGVVNITTMANSGRFLEDEVANGTGWGSSWTSMDTS